MKTFIKFFFANIFSQNKVATLEPFMVEIDLGFTREGA